MPYSGAVPPEETDATGGDLQHQVEELRQENQALRAADTGSRRRGHRWKSILSWILVVVACLLSVVSVVVVFARSQLLNTDAYVSTVTPLASNPAIQAAVANRVSEKLVVQTNLEQRVKEALPARAGFLATPITSGVQSATRAITLKAVQSPRFQKLWVAANRNAHQQLVNLLTGSNVGAVHTNNGKITLDLSQVEVAAKKALDARGITVFDRVPTINAPDLVLFQSSQLVKAQRLTRFLNKVVVILPILTLLLFAGAVVLARNRRRGLVRAATGLALSMALLLVLATVGRNQYLSSLDPSQSKDAASAVIDAVSAILLDTVRTILIVAVIVALGALIAGNSHVRSWVAERRKPTWMTDGPVAVFVVAHRKGLQWGVVGLGLFILVVWDKPTTLVAVVVVLIALALAGLVGLFAGQGSASSRAALGAPDQPVAVGAGPRPVPTDTESGSTDPD